LIYRHAALIPATYSINVVFLTITKAAIRYWHKTNMPMQSSGVRC